MKTIAEMTIEDLKKFVDQAIDNRLTQMLGTFEIAEESDDAIAQSLKHVAVIARDAHRAGILVAADDPLQHFRIHAAGQLGEPHHIAEQDGELAALACLCSDDRGRSVSVGSSASRGCNG